MASDLYSMANQGEPEILGPDGVSDFDNPTPRETARQQAMAYRIQRRSKPKGTQTLISTAPDAPKEPLYVQRARTRLAETLHVGSLNHRIQWLLRGGTTELTGNLGEGMIPFYKFKEHRDLVDTAYLSQVREQRQIVEGYDKPQPEQTQ